MNWRQSLRITAAAAALALMMPSAPAEIITLNPVKDATLVEDINGALANGSGFLFAGRTAQLPGTALRRALIQFDVSSINPAATINSVTLTLQDTSPASFATTINLHKVTADWNEGPTAGIGTGGGGGGIAVTGDVTWLHRNFNTVMWTTAGGDFEAVASASQAVNLAFQPYSWTSTQMVTDVEDWIANPSNNFGWILVGDESTGSTAHRFDSREQGVTPVLEIDVEPPSSVDNWSLY